MGLGLGIGLENKERSKEDQRHYYCKPLMANLDITLVKSHIECEASVTYIGGTILEIDVGGKVGVVGRVAAGVIGDSLCVCVCACVRACACVCMCVRASYWASNHKPLNTAHLLHEAAIIKQLQRLSFPQNPHTQLAHSVRMYYIRQTPLSSLELGAGVWI